MKNSILLIEDHKRGKTYKEYFETLFDYEVNWIDNLDKVISDLDNNYYDVILLDVMSPLAKNSEIRNFQNEQEIDNKTGMITGLVLLKMLQVSTIELPKIIIFTNRSEEKIKEISKNLSINYDGFINKDETPGEINKAIVKLLK